MKTMNNHKHLDKHTRLLHTHVPEKLKTFQPSNKILTISFNIIASREVI